MIDVHNLAHKLSADLDMDISSNQLRKFIHRRGLDKASNIDIYRKAYRYFLQYKDEQ